MRRRRECLECRGRFTTYEHVERRPLRVLKEDGSAEEFRRDKLGDSISIACAKRPVTPDDIEALVDSIEDMVSSSARAEIPSRDIGEQVMEGLKPLDRVAYVRFASVYRNFQRIDEFQEVVDELIVKERREGRSRFQGVLSLPLHDSESGGE